MFDVFGSRIARGKTMEDDLFGSQRCGGGIVFFDVECGGGRKKTTTRLGIRAGAGTCSVFLRAE